MTPRKILEKPDSLPSNAFASQPFQCSSLTNLKVIPEGVLPPVSTSPRQLLRFSKMPPAWPRGSLPTFTSFTPAAHRGYDHDGYVIKKNVSDNRDLKEQYREILAGRFLEVRQLAATFFNGNIESFPIESEDPTEALLNHLDTTDCSLVVIGRSGKGLKGLISDFLGGTAEEIIRHAGCPVLIVPVTN